jgi:hypothetical protein
MINLSDKVAGVMSLPRVGFTDPGFAIGFAMRATGIIVSRYQGAFWEQGIDKMIRIHRDRKYILTIDYDTYFTEYHVVDLFNIMEAHPEVGVLFPMQTKRNGGVPMFQAKQFLTGKKTESGAEEMASPIAEWYKDYIKADTGHFGLTLIRTEILEKLKKPWFEGKTNEDGEWEDGKVDPDMCFWYACEAAGIMVAVAPTVFVIHLEMLGSIPGRPEDAFKTFYLSADDVTNNVWPPWAKPKSAKEENVIQM